MSNRTSSQQSRLRPVGTFVAGHEVLTFFALTLAFTWAIEVPVAAGIVDLGSLAFGVITVGTFGPLVAAAIVTWLVGDSLRAWGGQVLRWRVRPRWYLAAVGIPLVVFAVTWGFYIALGNPIEPLASIQGAPVSSQLLLFALSMVLVFLIAGGNEELGWRGFALPQLLDRFDAVTASLVIGAVWAVWHLPLFMIPGSSQYGTPFVPFALIVVGLSILLTWLYRGTGRSVLLAMILHASQNSAPALSPFVPVQPVTLSWLMAAVMGTLALGLVVVYGRDLRSGESDAHETGDGRVPPAT